LFRSPKIGNMVSFVKAFTTRRGTDPRASRTDEYSTADWAQTYPSAYVNY